MVGGDSDVGAHFKSGGYDERMLSAGDFGDVSHIYLSLQGSSVPSLNWKTTSCSDFTTIALRVADHRLSLNSVSSWSCLFNCLIKAFIWLRRAWRMVISLFNSWRLACSSLYLTTYP